ncbi:hypothetical protein [Leptothrix discophora]|uniref:Uncharacterized protein n=1 Tax=Leptothrix discophora TaxID=89 RepID=A0ABT9G1K3_LEPDI|nr:hypothetical protein [Leptothrix discophora]MDP4300342.1 hypothetical protein [Leptothrix discophora]
MNDTTPHATPTPGKYRLVVGNVIDVPVKGVLKDGSRHLTFNFSVQARRLSLEELRDIATGRADGLLRDFLLDNIHDWRGQRLVLDEAGQHAAFSREALDCLLDLAGMEQSVYVAYMQALQIGETDAGRRGN